MSDETSPRDFPRAPKTVNTVKLKARQIAKDLEAKGFEIFDSSYGIKNIYYLVRYAPELLERVLVAMDGDSDTKRLWNQIIGKEFGFRASNSDRADRRPVYEKWLVMAPIHLKMLEMREDKSPERARSVTLWSDRLVEQTYPKERDRDLKTYAARIIFFELARSEGTRMTEEERSSTVTFIRENLEEVTRVLPDLLRRRTYDPEMIAVMMNVDAPALMDGAL